MHLQTRTDMHVVSPHGAAKFYRVVDVPSSSQEGTIGFPSRLGMELHEQNWIIRLVRGRFLEGIGRA